MSEFSERTKVPDSIVADEPKTHYTLPEFSAINRVDLMEYKSDKRLYGLKFSDRYEKVLISVGRIYEKDYLKSCDYPIRTIRLDTDEHIVGVMTSQNMHQDARHYNL